MCEEAIRDHFFIHLKIIYNTYMYMYIHREVKRSYAIWVDNATLNNHKTNKKNPVSCEELPLEFLVI